MKSLGRRRAAPFRDLQPERTGSTRDPEREVLFASANTPRIFGVDNIETALNPQLCRDVMKRLVELAKENDKQALITTHNPAILDGLNLHDDEQRLFVLSRGDEGATVTKRIKLKPEVKEGQRYKLSELWMRGHLGGIPERF